MKSWYVIKNKGNDCIDIALHDEIGLWGVSASEFINELKSNTTAKSINLSIHSPGGNMLDGLAMYNALKAHPAKVYSHVTGIAASAASTVLMAGDVITMPEDAYIMIHNPAGGAYGGSDEMRDYADVMDKLKAGAINIYAKKSGKDSDEISEMMDSETWLNSSEALDAGFIDTISDAVGVSNKANFSQHFKSLPFNAQSIDQKIEKIETIKDYETFLRDSGGLSKGLATALSSRAKSLFRSESEPPNNTAMRDIANALERLKVPASL